MGLPLHLQSATLLTLLASAQGAPHDDSPAMNEIVRRFEPLARRLAAEMTSGTPHLYDDVVSACFIALVRAVRRHDLSRYGFPKYAARFMRGAALRELANWQKELPPATLASVDSPDPVNSPEWMLEQLAPWGDGAVAAAVADLSESQRRILMLRYIEDASLGRIAQEQGTSVPAVSQRLATMHRAVALALAA